MPRVNMEELQRIDGLYHFAGMHVSDVYSELQAARTAEGEIAEERIELYDKAFNTGIFIDKVLEPSHVTYHAGFRQLFEGLAETDLDPVWLRLDAQHAEELEGAFAFGVRINKSKSLRRDLPGEQPRISIDFLVESGLNNANISNLVDEPHEFDLRTYEGPLEAIEWRLPTDAEVLRFGGTLATQDQLGS